MMVEEILPYEQYYRDRRFAAKIPDWNKGQHVFKCGDNIYPNGIFQHLQSLHCNEAEEDPEKKAQDDLKGRYVLISKTYYYFGS